MRVMISWPLLVSESLSEFNKVVTLKLLSDFVFNSGKTDYEISKDIVEEDSLKKLGIS